MDGYSLNKIITYLRTGGNNEKIHKSMHSDSTYFEC